MAGLALCMGLSSVNAKKTNPRRGTGPWNPRSRKPPDLGRSAENPALLFAIGRTAPPALSAIGSGRGMRRRESGRTDFPFNGAGELVLRHLEIVRGLKNQPKARAGIEVPSQPQSRIWSNAAALVDDLGNARHRDAEIERQPIHALRASGSMKSARRISPGWMGGRSFSRLATDASSDSPRSQLRKHSPRHVAERGDEYLGVWVFILMSTFRQRVPPAPGLLESRL